MKRCTIRALAWLGVVVSISMATAAAADAASVTRLRVQWSGPKGQWSPFVETYVDGTSSSHHTGPCQANPYNCKVGDGFRWEESDPNDAGHPQVFSLVDDRAEQGRRICVGLKHPYTADYPFGGPIQGTLVLTDPDGAARTVPFALDKGQSIPVVCTPPKSPGPPPAGPFSFDPPAWWRATRALIESRGAKCKRSVTQIPGADPDTGQPRGTYPEDRTECSGAIGRGASAGCVGSATGGNPQGDEYSYVCRVATRRSASANDPASWECLREAYFSRFYGSVAHDDGGWRARPTKLFPQIKLKTLARCRAPRVVVAHGSHSLRTAKRNGLRLRVACSHRCKITITLARPGAAPIGRGAATLKPGKGRVRVRLSRRPGGARKLIVRVAASATGHQGRARETARIQGSTLRFDDVLSVAMHRR